MEKSIVNRYGGLTPSKILRYFINNPSFQIEHSKHPYTFFVLGKAGPTGKTWMCTGLKEYGFLAFELSESALPFVNYNDCKNHVIKDDVNKNIVIILNQPLNWN